jgi:hypothetical protein
MFNFKPCARNLVLVAALAAIGLPAAAQPGLPDLTLNTWSALGDALATATSAQLSNGHAADGDVLFSGQSSWDIATLEAGMGLAPGALGLDATEGSALQTQFAAPANTTIGFDWVLATSTYDPGFADRAFVLVDGSPLISLGTVAAQDVTGHFSITLTAAGNHTLALGVLDVGDTAVMSTLSVSQLTVTSAVPEPATRGMAAMGLLCLAGLARRRQG